jgi:hypothetical protein
MLIGRLREATLPVDRPHVDRSFRTPKIREAIVCFSKGDAFF